MAIIYFKGDSRSTREEVRESETSNKERSNMLISWLPLCSNGIWSHQPRIFPPQGRRLRPSSTSSHASLPLVEGWVSSILVYTYLWPKQLLMCQSLPKTSTGRLRAENSPDCAFTSLKQIPLNLS